MKPLVALPDLNPPPDPVTEQLTQAFTSQEERLARIEPGWLVALRKAGIARFADVGLPTLRDEDWRFTNLAPLQEHRFQPTLGRPTPDLPAEALDGLALGDLPGDRLVFVDGHHSPALSHIASHGPGVVVEPFSLAMARNADAIRITLGQHADLTKSPFVALNQACFSDGAFVRIPRGHRLDQPVHLLFVSTGRDPGIAIHPRNLLLLERDAGATIVEHYLSLADAPTLTNAVTEIVAGENARMEHIRLQDESKTSFHFGFVRLQQAANSNVAAHCISLGARLFRHEYDPSLDGPGAECVLNGLYLAKGRQLADHHMVVDHAQPNCASHEYFNGILADQSRGVFHGRILIRPGAQKTDAKQTNKNLLLSNEARANSKPQLEIYADDVKCTHGATVGQLDPEAVFYLRARGIPEETARRMLVHSFAGEITHRIQHNGLREALDEIVWDWLESLEAVQIGRRDGSGTHSVAHPH
ncbi:MAG: Fe-S cluster assembly protein SufD [Verrucomicrobiales bacterium]|nr:Fe-S cluster assembly protein SufD [Verrucomicrobiales bacterium]